jgi:hypothetical protein
MLLADKHTPFRRLRQVLSAVHHKYSTGYAAPPTLPLEGEWAGVKLRRIALSCSRSVLQHAGEGEHIDPCRTRDLERPGDLSERGTSGEHIIHHQHLLALKRCHVRDGKRLFDVLAALAAAELHLWPRRPHAHQRPLQDGNLEIVGKPFGQHHRLIELPLHEALSMQGHWDDGVAGDAGKVGVEVLDGQLQQWLLQA